jgi:UMP-CMP kinase
LSSPLFEVFAYEITCEDEMPPTDREWNVYKKGVAPAPKVVLHHYDPRLPCPKPNVVFVLGGPGAGKGTMCELAESQLGWTHLSMGDLLRAEYQAGGETAAIIEEFLSSGKLVPNEIIVRLLKETMERVTRTTGKNNFLLDGFPRSLSNLDGWFEIFGRETELPKMLYFECPYAVLEKRILGRAKYSGRSDDNVESMKQRFDTFKAETLPTVEFFKRNNKCVQVDTSQDRQTVYALVCNHLAEYTDRNFAARPLTERAEILLGLRAYPPIAARVECSQIRLSPSTSIVRPKRRRNVKSEGNPKKEIRRVSSVLASLECVTRRGAKLVVGSHTHAPHAERGWAYQRELELLVEAGLSPSEAIQAGTRVNAEFFGAAD